MVLRGIVLETGVFQGKQTYEEVDFIGKVPTFILGSDIHDDYILIR